jgi:hypothetical protein
VSVQALQALWLWRQAPAVVGKGGARHWETDVGATSASGFTKECGVFGSFWTVRGGETAFCSDQVGPSGAGWWPGVASVPFPGGKTAFFRGRDMENTVRRCSSGFPADRRTQAAARMPAGKPTSYFDRPAHQKSPRGTRIGFRRQRLPALGGPDRNVKLFRKSRRGGRSGRATAVCKGFGNVLISGRKHAPGIQPALRGLLDGMGF